MKTGKREQWDIVGASRVSVNYKILEDCDLRSQSVFLRLYSTIAYCPEVFTGRGYSSVSVEFSVLVAPTSSQNSHTTCSYAS